MKYKISNVHLIINGEDVIVGVVLGEEDNPTSPFRTGYITNSEYEEGLKSFKYGKQQIGDLVYHCVGKFVNNVAIMSIEQKWIDELEKMGYNITELVYENKIEKLTEEEVEVLMKLAKGNSYSWFGISKDKTEIIDMSNITLNGEVNVSLDEGVYNLIRIIDNNISRIVNNKELIILIKLCNRLGFELNLSLTTIKDIN